MNVHILGYACHLGDNDDDNDYYCQVEGENSNIRVKITLQSSGTPPHPPFFKQTLPIAVSFIYWALHENYKTSFETINS